MKEVSAFIFWEEKARDVNENASQRSNCADPDSVLLSKAQTFGGVIMQLKLGEDPVEKKNEFERKSREEQKHKDDREQRERHFKENFRLGSTTVFKHKGEFFFWGDITHCGEKNIFHNARKIKSLMEQNGCTRGHMNYNDPPTFDSGWNWEQMEHERKDVYCADLYKFVRDEIVLADLIGKEPIGHVYKDDNAEEPSDPAEATRLPVACNRFKTNERIQV